MTKLNRTEESCLFCKIVSGKIPSSKFWENNDFVAILDLFPNSKGASLVISKKHVGSDIFKTDFTVVHAALDAAKQAASMLKKALKPSRVALVAEGVFVDHLHLKLYPLYEVNKFIDSEHEKRGEDTASEINKKNEKDGSFTNNTVFFEKFPGYVTTQGGQEWSREELEGLVGEIYNSSETK